MDGTVAISSIYTICNEQLHIDATSPIEFLGASDAAAYTLPNHVMMRGHTGASGLIDVPWLSASTGRVTCLLYPKFSTNATSNASKDWIGL